MKREIITTGDGSKTIHIAEWDEQYHSKHGAIQEARHVFLMTGVEHYVTQHRDQKEIAILEMGFGTGLNALLTYFEAQKHQVSFNYVGAEAYPVTSEEAAAMDYASQRYGDPFYHTRRHAIYLIIALIAGFIASKVSVEL